jgi:hypothetical protein
MRAAADLLAVLLLLAAAGSVVAQEKHLINSTPAGSLNPEPLPPLQNPDARSTPAKELFARKSTPFAGPPRSIGGHFDGCLAGAVPRRHGRRRQHRPRQWPGQEGANPFSGLGVAFPLGGRLFATTHANRGPGAGSSPIAVCSARTKGGSATACRRSGP